MRPAIRKALELARKGVDRLVLELPTGYGKTVAGPLLYKAYRDAGLCHKAIHVFPLRAILHKTLERYVQEHRDVEFAYQDGDVTLTERGYVKDPYFTREYVLTTLDSFIHNLFNAPVAELHKVVKGASVHYHIPFAYIYPSCVFFDEAHIAAQDERGKALAALKAAIELLIDAEIPVVVMSATLGRWKEEIFRGFTFVEIEPGDPFEQEIGSDEYHVEVIDEKDVVDTARRELREGRRVLIVVNNIAKAVQWHREIEGSVLIHSMLTRADRAAAEEQLKTAKAVVGTSAIEAGVDVSFDTLITSADSPESLAQRAGRICRYGGHCRGRIYIFGQDAEKYLKVRHWRLPHLPNSYADMLTPDPPKGREYHTTYWVLRELGYLLYVDPEELHRTFKKMKYSYVREAMVEIATTPHYDPRHAFPAAVSRIKFPVKTPQGQHLAEVDENFIEQYVKTHGQFPTLYTDSYIPHIGPVHG